MSIVGLNDAGADVGFLNLSTWSSTTCGIQIQPNSVMMGCGGSETDIPYNRIVFNTSGCEIYGNVDVSGNLSVDGIVNITNTTNSSNVDSGALVVDGGVGIREDVNVGGDIDVSGNLSVNGNLTVDNDLGVNGNLIYGYQQLDSSGNITTNNIVSLLNFDGTSGGVNISMNNASTVGQLKIISRISNTNNHNINVVLSGGGKYLNDGAGNTYDTITFNKQGDSVTLMYVGFNNWTVISQNNVSFSS